MLIYWLFRIYLLKNYFIKKFYYTNYTTYAGC